MLLQNLSLSHQGLSHLIAGYINSLGQFFVYMFLQFYLFLELPYNHLKSCLFCLKEVDLCLADSGRAGLAAFVQHVGVVLHAPYGYLIYKTKQYPQPIHHRRNQVLWLTFSPQSLHLLNTQNLSCCSFLQQYNKKMEECPKDFSKRKPQTKWTEEEKDKLKDIVEEIQPQNNKDWRQVCVKMHQYGSRRTQQEYKVRGINYLPNNQRQQIRFTDEVIDQIFMEFDQGASVKTIVGKFAATFKNQAYIRNVITWRLKSIQKIMRPIIGNNKIRTLAPSDYQFFGFVRSKKMQLPSLVEIIYHCERLRLIGRPRNEAERGQVQQIQLELKQYNSLLLQHTQAFIASQVKQPKGKKRNKACKGQPPTVPFMHLALAAKDIQTNKNYQHSQSSQSFLAQLSEKRLETLMTIPSMKSIMGEKDDIFSEFNHSFQHCDRNKGAQIDVWNSQIHQHSATNRA